MAIQFKRGAEATIPTLLDGQPGFTTDTHKVFVGLGGTNYPVGGAGTGGALEADTDTTLAANSDARVATQKAVRAFVESMVAGLLDLKGGLDCSANPNYPAASKSDAYYVTVAGRIGGAAGKPVDVGDVMVASADNAGGTEAAVGASWFILEHNLAGALLAANNLLDVADVATARNNLGLGTAAVKNTGTAGNVVPLLDVANTWSAIQTFGFGQLKVLNGAGDHHVLFGAFSSTQDGSVYFDPTGGARSFTITGNVTISGTNTGDQTITLTDDVTGGGTGSFTTTIGNDKVTDAKLRNSAAVSVIGRSTNSAGDPADIPASADGQYLQRTSGALAFATPKAKDLTGTQVEAYLSTNQSLPNSAWTTVQFDTETLDSLGEFNPSTFTFTPAETGTYLVSLNCTVGGASSRAIVAVWQGTATEVKRIADGNIIQAGNMVPVTLTAGTGYIFRAFAIGTGLALAGGSSQTSVSVRRHY